MPCSRGFRELVRSTVLAGEAAPAAPLWKTTAVGRADKRIIRWVAITSSFGDSHHAYIGLCLFIKA